MYVNCNLKTAQRKGLFQRYSRQETPALRWCVIVSHREILILSKAAWNSPIFTPPLHCHTLIFLSDFLIASSQSEQIKLEIPYRIVIKRRPTEDDDSGFLMFCLGWFSKVSFQYIATLQRGPICWEIQPP